MADTNTSKSGQWFDTKNGKVVSSEPEEGRLLVAPGGVITPDVNATIEQFKANAADDGSMVAEKTVTSKSAK